MILSIEMRYLSAAFLFLVSGAIQADVPYVFQEGDTIRANEINENFRHLDTEVGTLSDDVESGANSEGPDEDYSFTLPFLVGFSVPGTVLLVSFD